MAKVPAVHGEALFSGIRVAVSYEKSVLPDTTTSPQASGGGFISYRKINQDYGATKR